MMYAEVAIDAPVGYDKTLSYAIPSGIRLAPGHLVWVPLGQRSVQGVVFELTDRPAVEPVREVVGVYGPAPFLSATALALARWISRHYLSSLFEAAALMLPPGFRSRSIVRLRLASAPPAAEGLSASELAVLEYVTKHGSVIEEALDREMGAARGAIGRLVKGGWLERTWELPLPAMGLKYTCRLRLAVPADEAAVLAERVSTRAPRQAALLRTLAQASEAPLIAEARREFGDGAVKGLLEKGYVAQEWVRESWPPFPGVREQPVAQPSSVFTPTQQQAVAEIGAALERGPKGETFLLHEVRDSGRMEVYLAVAERCLALGKQVIFLVPEISLTPQVVERLTARFPGRVTVLHSSLTMGQQVARWWQIREGVYDVVVGARGALFAPLSRLGLIVLDEEHDWSYKQVEQAPRYHAREVAQEMARRAGAVLVMGSATPDVATYHHALEGHHRLLELPRPAPTAPQVRVEVVDMRRELREGNRSIFSRALVTALRAALEQGEQAILFLNRRGAATTVQCRDCGHVLHCHRCAVPLVYHAEGFLLCHQCNAFSRLPEACPQCDSRRIRYLGLGTQRVVEELQRLFPGQKVLRWDRDVVRAGEAYQALMAEFAEGAARILVGTQMVARALHVPAVTLVGVILADVGLYLPDLWASERTFQLLCQVVARAGHGSRPGTAIVQTYSPGHYAIQAAARQGYVSFYRQEVEFGRQRGYPPFSRLAHLVYRHANEVSCRREAERVGRLLRQQARARGVADVHVIGPAPAHPPRVRGHHRWHIIVRAPDPSEFLAEVAFPRGWLWDVDPVSVL